VTPIARSPTTHPNDEQCSICRAVPVIVVLQGPENCPYCGQQINLCDRCVARCSNEFALVLSECLAAHIQRQKQADAHTPAT
jgi:hypothetical protein